MFGTASPTVSQAVLGELVPNGVKKLLLHPSYFRFPSLELFQRGEAGNTSCLFLQ
jgi:hypothetical protein